MKQLVGSGCLYVCLTKNLESPTSDNSASVASDSGSGFGVTHLTDTMSMNNSGTGSLSRLLQRSTYIDAGTECSSHRHTSVHMLFTDSYV